MMSLLSVVCLLLLATPVVPAAGTIPWQEYLSLGKAVERELKGGESHSYRVRLEAGQYLLVVAEQKGSDVVVRLFGPAGVKLAEVDSPNGTQGPEPLAFVADEAGEYRLEVAALDQKAPPGRYEVVVREVRQATAGDRDRLKSARILGEAEQLRSQGTADSLRRALLKYKEALPLLRESGDRKGEGEALNAVGWVNAQLGDNQAALEAHAQALQVRRAAGDRYGEGESLTNTGIVYWQMGDNRKALEYYNQALPFKAEVGDRNGEAVTHSGMGLALISLGSPQESISHFDKALKIQRELGSAREEATVLNNLISAYYKMGELRMALEYGEQALALQRSARDTRGEALSLNNIGVLYGQLGEYRKAIEYHEQALPLRRSTGDRLGEISTLHNLGVAYRALGEPAKALGYYEQALALARASGDKKGEGYTLDNIGFVYKSSGDPAKALEFFNQALQVRRSVGDRQGEAITLSNIGATYTSLGKAEESLDYLGRALALHRAVGDLSNEAPTLRNMAIAERDRGNLTEARARIEEALGIVESVRSQFTSRQLRSSFSASRQDYYELHVDILMRMHGARTAEGYDREALRASERARARGLLEMLAESGTDIRQGVDAALLNRERSLQATLNDKAEKLRRLLSSDHTDAQASAARGEVDSLLAEYEEVESQIREKSPRYAALTQPRPLSAEEMQKELSPDTVLLEYALGEERSYLWAVTPTSVESFVLPKRAEVEAAARRVYGLLTARNRFVSYEAADKRRARVAQADAEFPAAAADLSRMLLGPVAARVRGKRLLIVADGALQYLPFTALPLPRAAGAASRSSVYVPLVAEHEIVSLPSSTVLAVLRRELAGRKPAPKTVAVLADPVFDPGDERVRAGKPVTTRPASSPPDGGQRGNASAAGDTLLRSLEDIVEDTEPASAVLPRLPFTRQEAESIAALAPKQSEIVLDFAASKAAATDPRLSQYRYIHFATHVVLNTRHPELSGIVLSLVDPEGKEQDGFLRAHEIYNLNLPSELVVLSGCRTGLGKDVRGEGLVGLTRGVMYAGAARVLVSLWKVEDRSTAELMARFYEGGMAGGRLSPAAALRSAQLRMWKSGRWRAPYYWAAFTLQGEYR